jgi:Cdc6-like AAA superfamily ATPase
MKSDQQITDKIEKEFELRTGLSGLRAEVKERETGAILVIKVANPTNRLFRILEQIRSEYGADESDRPLATLVREPGANLLQGAEGRLFLKTLSESLNINRYSFQEDFLSRYTKSVFGAEDQIVASANHIIYGRRGTGKSMLMLYALHTRESKNQLSAWIDMQVYARRRDEAVIADVLRDLLDQTSKILMEKDGHQEIIAKLQEPPISEDKIRQHLPSVRRLLSPLVARGTELFIFLDDFHVVSEQLQAKLLNVLYAVSRGNLVFLKLSAIETLTRTFDPATRVGLQVPHDAQVIRLDYNLTMPDKASQHIETILGAHAIYCGLPSIKKLCTSAEVIPRLTWVAAGVPRDAINLFTQAITKATLEGRKHVSVSNVNVAASETINTKLRELETDASADASELQELLDKVREFCVTEQRRNAFLVEIKADDPVFNRVRKLIDLRLLHVINEGITIREAGRKYLGLILDYGFYTGFRAARSVDLFNRQTGRVAYKDLRRLPVFE